MGFKIIYIIWIGANCKNKINSQIIYRKVWERGRMRRLGWVWMCERGHRIWPTINNTVHFIWPSTNAHFGFSLFFVVFSLTITLTVCLSHSMVNSMRFSCFFSVGWHYCFNHANFHHRKTNLTNLLLQFQCCATFPWTNDINMREEEWKWFGRNNFVMIAISTITDSMFPSDFKA